jgi:hypothetical protein
MNTSNRKQTIGLNECVDISGQPDKPLYG